MRRGFYWRGSGRTSAVPSIRLAGGDDG